MPHTYRVKLTFQHGFRNPTRLTDVKLWPADRKPLISWRGVGTVLASPRSRPCPSANGGVGSSRGEALIRLDCKRQQLKAVVLSETLSHKSGTSSNGMDNYGTAARSSGSCQQNLQFKTGPSEVPRRNVGSTLICFRKRFDTSRTPRSFGRVELWRKQSCVSREPQRGCVPRIYCNI